jgi:hypothetical protein
MKIITEELIKGKKTYPTWTTNSKYPLCSKKLNNKEVLIYYIVDKGIKRKIERKFPAIIDCDPSFCWIISLIKGEGSNSLGKSSYRRFTITNKDPIVIKKIIKELEEKKLFHSEQLSPKSCHLLHFTGKEEQVISYWSRKLELSRDKFKCFSAEKRTSIYGVCHIYLSDALLRRIIDLTNDKISNY